MSKIIYTEITCTYVMWSKNYIGSKKVETIPTAEKKITKEELTESSHFNAPVLSHMKFH